MKDTIKAIAKRFLQLDTLETVKLGSDFQEQAVWQVKAALEAAYAAGYEAGKITVDTSK
jgi:hypothetical protein